VSSAFTGYERDKLTKKGEYILDCSAEPHSAREMIDDQSRVTVSLFLHLIIKSPLVLQFEMVTDSNLYQVQSSDQFKELLSKDLQRVSLLYFWAPWAEPCKQMTEVVTELSKRYPKLLSLQIQAEEQNEISESFDIESVPIFIILRVSRMFEFLTRELDHSDPYFYRQRRVTHYWAA
jgi:thiol-disulfide isomerase/thioredoxin